MRLLLPSFQLSCWLLRTPSGNAQSIVFPVAGAEHICSISKHCIFCGINVTSGARRPGVIILQCGADALHGDPVGVFNLTTASVKHLQQRCICTISFGPDPFSFFI